MLSIEKSIRPLDWSLWLAGCTIFKSRYTTINCLVLAFGLMMVASRVFAACDIIMRITIKRHEFFAVAALFRSVLEEFSSAAVIIILWRHQSRIQSILRRCSSFLTTKDMSRILTLTSTLLLVRLLITGVTILDIILKVYSSIILHEKNVTWAEILGLLHPWEFVIFSVYVTLVKVIHAAEMSVYRSFMSKKCLNPKCVFIHISRFMHVKDEAMKSLSMIPCLSLLYLIFRGVSSIVWLQTNALLIFSEGKNANELDVLRSKINVAVVGIAILEITIMSFVTSNNSQECSDTLQMLEEHIVKTQQIKSMWLLTMEKIREAKSYEYLAWDFFSINKQLIISFFSSLLTFAVLCLQLLDQSK